MKALNLGIFVVFQGRLRIAVEHVNARIKTFKILGEKYRNRRKRFGLRFNLICALVNFDRGFRIV